MLIFFSLSRIIVLLTKFDPPTNLFNVGVKVNDQYDSGAGADADVVPVSTVTQKWIN